MTATVALFSTIVSKIKGHSLDANTVTSAQNSVSTIETQATGSGSPITDHRNTSERQANPRRQRLAATAVEIVGELSVGRVADRLAAGS